MKEYKVLFKIKSLEKMLVRSVLSNCNLEPESLKKLPTPTQMQIIEYILESKTEVYQRDLENILGLRRATVSGVLQTMEKNELIKRVPSSIDGRVKKITLHKKTEDIFLRNKRHIEEIERFITRNIDEEKLITFLEVLTVMKENIKEYTDLRKQKITDKEEGE